MLKARPKEILLEAFKKIQWSRRATFKFLLFGQLVFSADLKYLSSHISFVPEKINKTNCNVLLRKKKNQLAH